MVGAAEGARSRATQSSVSDMAEVEGEAVLKTDRLGTVFGGDAAEVRGDRVEGLVPADLDPAGIGVALRPCPLQRLEEASGVVDDLRRVLALEAQRLAGRMFRVGIEGDERPSVTVAIAPQRETQRRRNRVCARCCDRSWACSFRSVGDIP